MTKPESRSDSPMVASIERLRKELDHWLDVAWSQGERALDAVGWKGAERSWTPSVDLVETADQMLVFVELPGVDRQAVQIHLAGNMLTLQGTKPATPLNEGHTGHLQERTSGDFARSIPMPVPVDSDQVSAEFHDGVLKIVLAKTAEAKSRQIEIQTGNPPQSPAPPAP